LRRVSRWSVSNLNEKEKEKRKRAVEIYAVPVGEKLRKDFSNRVQKQVE